MHTVRNMGIALGALFIAAVLLNAALVPAAALAKTSSASAPTQANEPVATGTTEKIGKGPTEEQKNFVFDAIDASNLSAKEKSVLMNDQKNIWSNKSTLSESKKQEVINQAAMIVFDYYGIDQNDEITIEWANNYNSNVHGDLAWESGYKFGTGYLNVLYSHACDPDTWGLPQMIQHYSWGGAADKCKLFADSARNYIKNQSNPTAGYTDLSVSMHYMSDIANPWHTKPLEYQLRHSAYEDYVCQYWNTAPSPNYNGSIWNNWYYYYINDPKAAVDNLASVSTQYFGYLDNAIAQNPDWKTDQTVIDDTRTEVLHAIRYDMGLVDYVIR